MGVSAFPGADAPEPAPVAFDVLDVFEGFATLTRRNPTLDGAVPVRVAQACLPLLEGNGFGFQVGLTRPLRVSRVLGSPAIRDEALQRLHAAALPRLLAHGLIARGGGWHRALQRSFAWSGWLPRRRPRLQLFTGLLVRPRPGTWLRLGNAANRRNALIDLVETVIPDDAAYVPLTLDLSLPATGWSRVRLEGEVACLAPVQPGVGFSVRGLEERPEIGHAHARFYDQAYFDEKRKAGVTVKYRRMVGNAVTVATPAPAACEVVVAGPVRMEVENVGRFVTAAGPRPLTRPQETRRLESLVFRNAVGFSALYDGHTLALDYSRPALARAAGEVARRFAQACGEDFAAAHRGALLYLTKYFTPHPPGEPHFFVKPWAFTVTPPGWSSLLDGVHGAGYDVLRGVVATDTFHATPAVFLVRRTGRAMHVPAGRPLLRVLPVPRRLLEAGFSQAALPDAPS